MEIKNKTREHMKKRRKEKEKKRGKYREDNSKVKEERKGLGIRRNTVWKKDRRKKQPTFLLSSFPSFLSWKIFSLLRKRKRKTSSFWLLFLPSFLIYKDSFLLSSFPTFQTPSGKESTQPKTFCKGRKRRKHPKDVIIKKTSKKQGGKTETSRQ